MLKKLASNQTVMILAAVVVVVALYSYSNGFNISLSGMSGANEAAKSTDAPASDSGSVQPAQPLGQNSTQASASGSSTDTYGLPPSCAKQQVVDPSQLLPKDSNSEFSKLNPMGAGDLGSVNLLKAGHHIGINTVGQSLRNANLQLRSEPPNPQLNVGPWNQSTITSDTARRPLEIGH